MAAEKRITITVNEKGLGIDMQGFINKAEGLAVLVAAVVRVDADLVKDVLANREEILKGIAEHGVCSCPACEARAAQGPLQ